MFHYTNQIGYDGILASQQLKPSTATSNPHDIRYGEGQYLSDVEPGMKSPAQLSRILIGHPFQGQRFTHYLEIEVTGLTVIQGRPGVWVIPNNLPLDLTQRIIRSGKVG